MKKAAIKHIDVVLNTMCGAKKKAALMMVRKLGETCFFSKFML